MFFFLQETTSSAWVAEAPMQVSGAAAGKDGGLIEQCLSRARKRQGNSPFWPDVVGIFREGRGSMEYSPDTDRVLTLEEAAAELDAFSTTVTEDPSLPEFDPDDYPLF